MKPRAEQPRQAIVRVFEQILDATRAAKHDLPDQVAFNQAILAHIHYIEEMQEPVALGLLQRIRDGVAPPPATDPAV